jgi:hypothetical protein
MLTNQQATNYYCNQKFWWLSIDIERFQTLSCCAATAHKIDFAWLKDIYPDNFIKWVQQ